MQYQLLDFLKCPLTKINLKFQLISEFKKEYSNSEENEIYEGILFSDSGFVFPIIEGIPRMLLESIYDYSDFLIKYLDNYDEIKRKLENNYPSLLEYCCNKNKKTKKSFKMEWDFLNTNKEDKLWHQDLNEILITFLNETGCKKDDFKDKIIIDVGSGHGEMTKKISNLSKIAVGVELSKAVETAYLNNDKKKTWFIQGDLQYLPFNDCTFDVVYSSGVIHHTNNTELSLSLIETILKKNGKLCLWLYHPQKSLIHNFSLFLRRFTRKIPIELLFVLLMIFIFPFSFLIKQLVLKKNKPHYREEIIDLLDSFSPEFRFEVNHDLAFSWLQYRNYQDIRITTINQFGFSIIGNKT